ncbi:hypothetical protein [Albimonas pacifica]|uniref:Concanavalin A-like lectin/glucanases superfamily protein n=1 Tax=Albimonas pacifica TaxID=1114924 RepID=A0A1I3QQ41_9RHOB|nr:hypothetical protein [Albimonas pacifica]SFJ35900.1 hypothetical protein SAMN05216258_1553 [Albimonas pacifica]
MSDLVAPGSAGHGSFRVTPAGQVNFDPQGGDGAWPVGVTETRLRGLVRDAQGRLAIADLARVDVSREEEGLLPPGWAAALSAHGGVVFAATYSDHFSDAAGTSPTPINGRVRVQTSVGDALNAVSPSDATRPTLLGDGTYLGFQGEAWLDVGAAGGVLPSLVAQVGESWTVSCVALIESQGTLVARAASSGVGGRTFQIYGSTSLNIVARGVNNLVPSGYSMGQWFAITVRCANGAVTATLDGSTWFAVSVGSASPESTPILMAARANGGYPLDGGLGAVLLLRGAASDAEVLAMHVDHAALIASMPS